MEEVRFRALVERLERESAEAPRAYRTKVALLALLGFAVLFVVLGMAGLGLLLLGGLLAAAAFSGGVAALILVKLGKILFFLAVPLWMMLKSSVQALFVRLPAPQGRAVTRAEAPALFAALDEMRTRMRGPAFHHVLIVDEVNAGVVQLPVFGLVGWPRNYLLLGLPLLESLSSREALAVVAHEYGHLSGSHSKFSAFIYRLRHTFGTVEAHAEAQKGWVADLVKPLIGWYAPYFNAFTFALARANEFEADAASADLVGSGPAANALKRVNLVDPRHQDFLRQTFDRIAQESEPPRDLMQRWAQHVAHPLDETDATRWLGSALDRERHYADTHPVLRARLAALPHGGDDASLDRPPPPLDEPSAAQAWLGDALETIRGELQSAWYERLREPWGERHHTIAQDRARLDVLRALASPSTEETIERFQKIQALEPDVDLRDDLAAFNRAHPDHGLGSFLEGMERLKRGDDAGIGVLERVMALDPEATLVVCQTVHGFLIEQKRTEEAEAWVTRWHERRLFEAERQVQLDHLDPKHELVESALPAEALESLRRQLQGPVVASVRRLRIARRVLPADASLQTDLVGVELIRSFRSVRKRRAVIEGLAALEWPRPVLIIELRGEHARWKPKFARLRNTQLWPAEGGIATSTAPGRSGS